MRFYNNVAELRLFRGGNNRPCTKISRGDDQPEEKLTTIGNAVFFGALGPVPTKQPTAL
jgi:hypothetical protein